MRTGRAREKALQRPYLPHDRFTVAAPADTNTDRILQLLTNFPTYYDVSPTHHSQSRLRTPTGTLRHSVAHTAWLDPLPDIAIPDND
jgi:hypothetical protein